MARYCTSCGRLIEEGKRCVCQQDNKSFKQILLGALDKVFARMGVHNPLRALLDTPGPIIPENVNATENETPIKQYHIATLRSRIRGQYTKAYLQVTNKRLLIHGTGISYQGHMLLHHEFAIPNIAGFEIKKTNRISFLNLLYSHILQASLVALSGGLFDSIAKINDIFALLLSLVFAVACVAPFFFLKKKFWIKFFLLSLGMGALMSTGEVLNGTSTSILTGPAYNIADFALALVALLWWINEIFLCLVPDLMLIIKAEGGTEAIVLKRKRFASPFKPGEENSGFSEILPGKDIVIASNELGAMIDDIQTFGDVAIDKWKE